jgi:iron-sulfur cluster assembly protein
MALPKMNVITLTDAAADRIRALMSARDSADAALRVGIKNGGCAGMSYTMDAVDQPDPADDVVHDKDVTVYIDPKAVLFLLGSQMDYQVSKLSSGFVFNNPNQTAACGCGESVTLTEADPDALKRFTSQGADPAQ